MNPVLNLLSAGGLALMTASSSHAGIIFATDLQGGWGDSGRTATIGTPFAVGSSAVSVIALGFFDQTGLGLSTAHEVGIYSTDISHNLLGSVLVPSGNATAFHDGTRWMTLSTPIALAANTDYMLAFTATETGDKANVASRSQVTIASPLALSGGGYTFTLGSSLAYPTVDLNWGVYSFGANMEITAIPEPSPLVATVMVLLVVVGCDFCRRYRLNRAE